MGTVAIHFTLDADAGQIVSDRGIPLPTEDEVKEVERALRCLVPARAPASVSAVLNAAWLLAEDADLWKKHSGLGERKTQILTELSLKTLEVFDIAERRSEHEAAKTAK